MKVKVVGGADGGRFRQWAPLLTHHTSTVDVDSIHCTERIELENITILHVTVSRRNEDVYC